ncbi:CU044_5270 family protein [Streptosporangium sp. NBC_01756]|uniref:CU044_5270 family protein n=1 Tax=Streptosporangium sp. NBC_01756 TaxID=2975950 RepID=UPI002DDAE18C|nr:CU044_5270 family protein [Streptosporangium sp. NBC_01756]WSC88402.1 CU044_5270 family protein [Streptosporangium sp. NBC_01756]
MNDLEEIATLLAEPEPSAGAVARGRDRLQRRARAGRARRRAGWFVPGVALVAAGAAAAVVLATGAPTNDGVPVTGKEVLLMAAVSAERTPQGSGTYWHVTRQWSTSDSPSMESWTRRDGKRWSKGEPGDPADAVVPVPAWKTLSLKGAKVSFEDLERLPTDPEALKAWIAERKGNENDMSASEIQGDPTFTLLALITELPAPAEVRSAAFRALAAMPGVENAGAVEGGQRLRFPDPEGGKDIELVVDPEQARVTRANLIVVDNGDVAWSDKFISVTTEWTDRLPSVQQS